MKSYWMGPEKTTAIEDMTREELIDVVYELQRQVEQTRERAQSMNATWAELCKARRR